MSKLDVILINYNNSYDTVECINSLMEARADLIRKIIIVDNSESNETNIRNNFVTSKLVYYIKTVKNLGFPGGNNLGIKESLKDKPDYILLLNNDTIVKEDFLGKLITKAQEEDADLATGKIYYYNKPDIIWGAGGWMDWRRGIGRLRGINQRDNGQFDVFKRVSFISGCMMLIRSEVFEMIGTFDEKYFMYCEDVDFCLRAIKEKLKLIYVPDSVIWHKVGAINLNKDPFCFYYFIRNSIFIVSKFATFKQKIIYWVFAPIYFSLKLLQSILTDFNFLAAFVFALYDGLRGNPGAREYGFLRKT